MGYSCSAWADETMEKVLEHPLLKSTDILKGDLHLERGKENKDGAITGTVWIVIDDEKHCKKLGTYRINRDGSIERFAGIPKKEWATYQGKIQSGPHYGEQGFVYRKNYRECF